MGTVVTALASVVSVVRRVEVFGDSMLPALRPGERLLVVRTRRARPGQLVVVRDPRVGNRTLVKRVVAREGKVVEVVGDNGAVSTDSAAFGPVPVRALVVYRYHPAHRAGRVR
ncbi:MAG: S26 family signal peptidase [Acidimicrobiales bacterium]